MLDITGQCSVMQRFKILADQRTKGETKGNRESVRRGLPKLRSLSPVQRGKGKEKRDGKGKWISKSSSLKVRHVTKY